MDREEETMGASSSKYRKEAIRRGKMKEWIENEKESEDKERSMKLESV